MVAESLSLDYAGFPSLVTRDIASSQLKYVTFMFFFFMSFFVTDLKLPESRSSSEVNSKRSPGSSIFPQRGKDILKQYHSNASTLMQLTCLY